ncbi:MAG: UDP-N-acetylmuramoyl-tripeptide--D-alanyl-D-alanine ligase [Chlorobi bacterium]|nr:UDP-N-acetylmuramoyl-tripeptide--D-alanyl-D-alanine ligase [Chlorobiota bacterium]
MQTTINKLYGLFLEHPKISTDSRNIIEGSLFFALKGENFNGNKYAEDALSKGAAFAIIDEKEHKKNNRFFLVEDVLKSLQELAKFHRQQLHCPIIAITGTNGKTTTKELIREVLSEKHKTKATTGNLNNHIGVPLTLLSFSKDLEMGIVEMGANHPNEIAALCDIAQPDFGLITNIGKAHLEGFGSFEGVIRAKSELYSFIKNAKGKIFINEDNELLKRIGKGIPQISYGTSDNCFVKGKLTKSHPFINMAFSENGNSVNVNSRLVGTYNFENLMAAVCIGKYFDVGTTQIKNALEAYRPKNQRSQFLKTKSNEIIIDAYNANPTSMKAAIDSFAQSPMNDKVLILGDMLELGKDSLKEHKNIISLIKNRFESIFLVGEQFCIVAKGSETPCFKSTSELKEYLSVHPLKNTSILLKASRGIQIENVLDIL